MKFTHTNENFNVTHNFQKQNTDAKVVISIYFKQLQIVLQTLKSQNVSYRTPASFVLNRVHVLSSYVLSHCPSVSPATSDGPRLFK